MANPEELKLLIQCLAAISMADDDLDGREIATQISMIEQITGTAPSAEEIFDASIDLEDWQDFLATLSSKAPGLDAAFATKILHACILIGRADNFMTDEESERIRQLSAALGISQEQLDKHLETIR